MNISLRCSDWEGGCEGDWEGVMEMVSEAWTTAPAGLHKSSSETVPPRPVRITERMSWTVSGTTHS